MISPYQPTGEPKVVDQARTRPVQSSPAHFFLISRQADSSIQLRFIFLIVIVVCRLFVVSVVFHSPALGDFTIRGTVAARLISIAQCRYGNFCDTDRRRKPLALNASIVHRKHVSCVNQYTGRNDLLIIFSSTLISLNNVTILNT